MLESLKAGLRAVRDDKALRGLIGLSFVGSFCAMPLVTFLPVFAQKVFHRDAKGYSALLAAFGIGAVVGAIAVAGVGHVRRKGILAVAMQMTFGGAHARLRAFARNRPVLRDPVLRRSGADGRFRDVHDARPVERRGPVAREGRVRVFAGLPRRDASADLVAGFLASTPDARRAS